VAAKVSGYAAPGDPADFGGDLLNDGEQGKAQDECPGQPIAELGTDLAVGADSAGVIIRRAGDQTRSQLGEKPFQSGGLGLVHTSALLRCMPFALIKIKARLAREAGSERSGPA